MEFLEKIGVIFSTVLSTIERFVTGLFGSSNERRVRQIGFVRDKKTGETKIVPGSPLDKINKLEPVYEKLTDDELKLTASRLRTGWQKGSRSTTSSPTPSPPSANPANAISKCGTTTCRWSAVTSSTRG